MSVVEWQAGWPGGYAGSLPAKWSGPKESSHVDPAACFDVCLHVSFLSLLSSVAYSLCSLSSSWRWQGQAKRIGEKRKRLRKRTDKKNHKENQKQNETCHPQRCTQQFQTSVLKSQSTSLVTKPISLKQLCPQHSSHSSQILGLVWLFYNTTETDTEAKTINQKSSAVWISDTKRLICF